MIGSHYAKSFLRAVLAGMAIGMGGCVFMGTADAGFKWVGAILFSIGLFTVFTFGLDLYTGKVGYFVNNKPPYLVYLLVIIVGNFVGTLITGYMIPMEDMVSDATISSLVAKRLTDIDYFRVFCKGVFCGILMFIAADYYKTKKKYLATFVCVPVFILAGFEHSIADMFYFCSGGAYIFDNDLLVDAVLFILVVLLGNAVGGAIIPECRKYMYEKEPEAPAEKAE